VHRRAGVGPRHRHRAQIPRTLQCAGSPALTDPALHEIATIVRGADTARLDLAPQAAGLLAISLGLSRMYPDDHEMLERGFVMYDALLAWCREARSEQHTWNPQRSPG
jgi:hypothetical protein